jgi:hypothetical protein
MRRQIRLISSDVWRANRDACGGLCNCGSALSAAFGYLLDDPTEEDPPPVSGGDSTRSSGAVSISVYEIENLDDAEKILRSNSLHIYTEVCAWPTLLSKLRATS